MAAKEGEPRRERDRGRGARSLRPRPHVQPLSLCGAVQRKSKSNTNRRFRDTLDFRGAERNGARANPSVPSIAFTKESPPYNLKVSSSGVLCIFLFDFLFFFLNEFLFSFQHAPRGEATYDMRASCFLYLSLGSRSAARRRTIPFGMHMKQTRWPPPMGLQLIVLLMLTQLNWIAYEHGFGTQCSN